MEAVGWTEGHTEVGPEALLRAAHTGSATVVTPQAWSQSPTLQQLPLEQLRLEAEQMPKGDCSSAAPGCEVFSAPC